MKKLALGLGLLLSLTTQAIAYTSTACLESFGNDGESFGEYIAAEITSNSKTGLTESVITGISFDSSQYCEGSIKTGYGLQNQADDASPVSEKVGCFQYGNLDVYLLAQYSRSEDTGLIVSMEVLGEFSALEYCLSNL